MRCPECHEYVPDGLNLGHCLKCHCDLSQLPPTPPVAVSLPSENRDSPAPVKSIPSVAPKSLKNKRKLGFRGFFFIGHTLLIILIASSAIHKPVNHAFPLLLLVDYPWAYVLVMVAVDGFRISNSMVLLAIFGVAGGLYWFLIGWLLDGVSSLFRSLFFKEREKTETVRPSQSSATAKDSTRGRRKWRGLLSLKLIFSKQSFLMGIFPVLSLFLADGLEKAVRYSFAYKKSAWGSLGSVLIGLVMLGASLKLIQRSQWKFLEKIEVKRNVLFSGAKVCLGALFAMLPFMLFVSVFAISFSITQSLTGTAYLGFSEWAPGWVYGVFVNVCFCCSVGAAIRFFYGKHSSESMAEKGR
jgi:hypothetical protein